MKDWITLGVKVLLSTSSNFCYPTSCSTMETLIPTGNGIWKDLVLFSINFVVCSACDSDNVRLLEQHRSTLVPMMAEGANKRTLDKVSLTLDTSQSKKHKGGESLKNEGDSTVTIYSGTVSLSDKLSTIKKIAVDVCGHCNESCDADGVKG